MSRRNISDGWMDLVVGDPKTVILKTQHERR